MKVNVLLVDDEVDLLEVTQEAISDYFDEVYTANSVQAALSVLKNHEIHVVVCDFKMPHEDGLKLKDILTANFPHVHFMMLTGYGNDPRISEAMEKQKFEILDKPTRPDVLVGRIQSSLFAPGLTDVMKSFYKRQKEIDAGKVVDQLDDDKSAKEVGKFVAKKQTVSKAHNRKKPA